MSLHCCFLLFIKILSVQYVFLCFCKIQPCRCACPKQRYGFPSAYNLAFDFVINDLTWKEVFFLLLIVDHHNFIFLYHYKNLLILRLKFRIQNGAISDHKANPLWSTHVNCEVPCIRYPGSQTNTTLSPAKLDAPIITECAGCCNCVHAFPKMMIKKNEYHPMQFIKWIIKIQHYYRNNSEI